MKIVFIIPDLSYGGAERLCIQLCNFMAEANDVTLVSLCDLTNEMYPTYLLDSKVRLITLGKHSGFNYLLFVRLYRLLKSLGPSVINANMAGLLYLSPYMLLSRKIRIFYTVHTFANVDAPSWYYYFYSILLKLKKVEMISNSMAVSNSVQNAYGKNYNRYIYIGSCKPRVSNDFLHVKQEVESYKTDSETQVFIHVGRIAPVKNQILLYNAFHRLFREGYNIILVILGSIQSKKIFSQLEKLSHPRIYFLGKKDNVLDYLASSNVFCLTSDYEGLSLATIEAMSMKVIPVCTPSGGVVEVVDDGYNGFLSNDNTVESYVDTVKRYFELSNEEVETMRDRAFNTYKHRFTIERCGEEYMDLYKTYPNP